MKIRQAEKVVINHCRELTEHSKATVYEAFKTVLRRRPKAWYIPRVVMLVQLDATNKLFRRLQNHEYEFLGRTIAAVEMDWYETPTS